MAPSGCLRYHKCLHAKFQASKHWFRLHNDRKHVFIFRDYDMAYPLIQLLFKYSFKQWLEDVIGTDGALVNKGTATHTGMGYRYGTLMGNYTHSPWQCFVRDPSLYVKPTHIQQQSHQYVNQQSHPH
jgi:hypothetical protein